MYAQLINPPVATVIYRELTSHGHSRIDNYFWLNNRKNEEVDKYLIKENSYTSQALAEQKDLETKLFDEMKSRTKSDDNSVPYKVGNYFYQVNHVKGGEYPIYVRRKGSLSAQEEVLFDCNILSKSHNYYKFGGYAISNNGRFVIFCEDTVGNDQYTLKIKDIKTGGICTEKIGYVSEGNFAWISDNKTFYYVVKDSVTQLGSKVYRHMVGNNSAKDVLIYQELDKQYHVSLYYTKSKEYIVISCSILGVNNELRLIKNDRTNKNLALFISRQFGYQNFIYCVGNKFFVQTDYRANYYRLLEINKKKIIRDLETGVSFDSTLFTNCREVVPNRKDTLIEGIEVFRNHIVLSERTKGRNKLRVVNLKTKKEHYIDFGEPAYLAGFNNNPNYDTNLLRYGYTSLTTPLSTYDYDMNKRTKITLKTREVDEQFSGSNYISERVFVTVRDGVAVPVSIVRHKSTLIDGTAPLLQYAYGAYGDNTEASFSSNRLSLLDRGFVYVIAHVRGGLEMGPDWYHNGKMLKKKNTFTDFIDVSKWLIANKYVASDKLFAMGSSAGGLIMGVICNEAPELYRGVIADVPFVDVVTTMLDETIPLTTGEFDEWGDPKNKEYYDYILSYSPYDNVQRKAYPNMLVLTGINDAAVPYWEPAKWVAKLRAMKTDTNLLVLHTDMNAGHDGSQGRFNALKEVAMKYAFLLTLAGKQN